MFLSRPGVIARSVNVVPKIDSVVLDFPRVLRPQPLRGFLGPAIPSDSSPWTHIGSSSCNRELTLLKCDRLA
jgi:hypothetical protein